MKTSRIYSGQASIVRNTKGEIALVRDAEGAFNATNAAECAAKMAQLAKSLKAPISKWAMFVAPGGKTPVMLANRWGAPYIALLPGDDAAPTKRVEKLA
jgi:hypothetical protein